MGSCFGAPRPAGGGGSNAPNDDDEADSSTGGTNSGRRGRSRGRRRRARSPPSYHFSDSYTSSGGGGGLHAPSSGGGGSGTSPHLAGKNKPLRREKIRWKSDVPLTEGQLKSKRDEFWETAPAFEGKQEIWNALKAAAEASALEGGDESGGGGSGSGDFALAQAILDGAGISLPHGQLIECYDELGTRYAIPVYCLSYPVNIVLGSSDGDDNADSPAEFSEPVSSDQSKQPATRPAGQDMKVRLRVSLTGKDVRMILNTADTVAAAKKKLQARDSSVAEPIRQRWYYGGKLLGDKTLLGDAHIPSGHVVQCVINHHAESDRNQTKEKKKFVVVLRRIMSIACKLSTGWFVCHEKYIRDRLDLTSQPIFGVETPFRMDLEAARIAGSMNRGESDEDTSKKTMKRKRKSPSSPYVEETALARTFLEELKTRNVFGPPPVAETIAENNRPVRDLVARLGQSDADLLSMGSLRHKNEKAATTLELWDRRFYVPSQSELILDDASRGLSGLAEEGRQFDVVLMDPPWENKHVRREHSRGRGYQTQANEWTGELAVDKILAEGGLVLVWCTPSKRHQMAIEGWFEKWGLEMASKWVWLKVTRSGEPVVEWDRAHKQPFEFVFLGQKPGANKNVQIPAKRVICSVPSAIQSHKPPLTEILEDVCPNYSTCLEVFGRYLLPGWTTLGNECLKYQQEHYFYS